jgi:hypothetical protein
MSKFGDYLWQLLPRFFKHLTDSEPRKWVNVFGASLDETKQSIFLLRRAWLVATASGTSLDLLGKARGIIRYPDEDDERFRVRIMAAFDIYSAGGTIPGMTQALDVLGYPDATIYELFRDGVVTPLHNNAGQYNGTLQHKGGIRWAEFNVLTGIEDTRSFTKTDLQILWDTIYKMKPAHTMPRALVLSMDFSDKLQATEKTVTRLTETLSDLFPYVGLSHNGAVQYGGYFARDGVQTYGSHLKHLPTASAATDNLHNTQRDTHCLASNLHLIDKQTAQCISRALGFRHNRAAYYGANPSMLELSKLTVAASFTDRESLKDAIHYQPVANLTSRFPGEITLHDGWHRDGTHYGLGRILDNGKAQTVLNLTDTLPGTYTYGERINHRGDAMMHNGFDRQPRRCYTQGDLHDGLVRHQSFRKYGDRFQKHNGLFYFGGRIRRHDQSFTHVRKRGVRQEYIAV